MTIRERIEPQLFAASPTTAVERSPSSEPAPGKATAEGQLAESSPKLSVGRWIRGLVLFGVGIALAVLGIARFVEADPLTVQDASLPAAADTKLNFVSSATDSKTPDYAAVAALPCTKFLNAYSTIQLYALSRPLIEAIRARGDGFGTGTSITDFVATECRLHEKIAIGQAVENLLDQQRNNRLPEIPIGGATTDPDIQASRKAFDRWIHHRGPRPNFDATSPSKKGRSQASPALSAETVSGSSSLPRPKRGQEEANTIAVEMSVSATSDNPPVVTGTTNLPDGTRLTVDITGEPPACVPHCFFGFPQVVVSKGHFTIGAELTGGKKLISGFYKVNVLMMPHPQSDPIVRSVIGPKGENLRGPYVFTPGDGPGAPDVPVKFPRTGPPSEGEKYVGFMINYTQRVFVASNSVSDDTIRSQAIADHRKSSVEACTYRIDLANGFIRSGIATGREVFGAERQARIDACIDDSEQKMQRAMASPRAPGTNPPIPANR